MFLGSRFLLHAPSQRYLVAAPLFGASRVAQAEAGKLDAAGTYATGARKGCAPRIPGAPISGLPTLQHMAAEGGVLSLWRGSEVLVARGALLSATQITTYDLTKGYLRTSVGLADGPLVHCIASFVASAPTRAVMNDVCTPRCRR